MEFYGTVILTALILGTYVTQRGTTFLNALRMTKKCPSK
jgi:hypothetical protein